MNLKDKKIYRELMEINRREQEEMDDRILDMYLLGSTVKVIANHFSVGKDYVRDLIKRKGILPDNTLKKKPIKIRDTTTGKVKIKIKEGMWVYYDPKKKTEQQIRDKYKVILEKQSRLML